MKKGVMILALVASMAHAIPSPDAQRLATQAVGGGLVYDVEQVGTGFVVMVDHDGRRYQVTIDEAGKVVNKKTL